MKITFEGNVVSVINEMRTFLSSNENIISIKENSLKDVKIPIRSKKHFTDFEIEFLTQNYKTKSISWIAAKLSREKTQIYTQLHKLYKLGLPLKNNRVKTL